MDSLSSTAAVNEILTNFIALLTFQCYPFRESVENMTQHLPFQISKTEIAISLIQSVNMRTKVKNDKDNLFYGTTN